MSLHARIVVSLSLLGFVLAAQSQQPAPGGPQAPRPGGPNLGVAFAPAQTDRYHADLVKLGGAASDGLLFTPAVPNANPRIAIVTTYGPPAVELAGRGYRVLLVRHQNKPGEVATPFNGFEEISRAIAYARTLAGVQRVAVLAWGTGSTTMILYVDVALHGPSACRQKNVIYPCTTEQATGLAKPDGIVLLDPGSGAGLKVTNVNPAYENATTRKADLDLFAAANGYDIATGTATYSPAFRKRYFAAQSARYNQAIDQAVARLKVLDQAGAGADEPLSIPAVVASQGGSLHSTDLTLLSHTKQAHPLLKADGTTPSVIIHSIRPAGGPKSDDALNKLYAQYEHPRDNETLRQFLANDALRTTKDYALTETDMVGIDWKSSNAAEPAHAEGITVPTLVLTNTCFQFVVPSEIVFDHIAAKDKSYAGVEGSEHFFTPCKPEFGDTKKRLFDYVDGWLAKAGRF
jgi:hypothetical protein